MLIILSKSPQGQNLNSVLEIASATVEKREKAAILHIQDACMAVSMNDYCEKLAKKKIDVYALKADCEARGLVEKTGKVVKLIDFRQWVKLVMSEHENVVSWTS
jgi:sulfur relay protein TusB/DsrH